MRDEFGKGRRLIDEVEQGRWTELERDVQERVALFFAEVADHVGVVVRLLEQVDLVGCDRDKVLQESLDRDSAPLEFASEDDRPVRSITWKWESVRTLEGQTELSRCH